MHLVRYERPGQSPAIAWLEHGVLYGAVDPLRSTARGPAQAELHAVRLLAPCLPGKVVGLAINYRGVTGEDPATPEPLVFLKPGTAVCGPDDAIICPFSDVDVWGEAELAFVVRRRLRNATPAEARDAILGYLPANDVSAGNIGRRDHHLARSKAADTFCPLGPWIDVAYDPADRLVEGFQNGDLIRAGRTGERLWQDVEALCWLSRWMTFEPWDVVLTGAPPRVGPRRYLRPGDRYTVRIEGLGELTSSFGYRAEGLR